MTFFGGLFKSLAAAAGAILALSLFTAEAAPTASFSMVPDGNPVVGQVAQFTDTSTGTPTSWSWNFGDGQVSTLQSPTHVFGGPGPFTVTLTATNATGSNQASQSIFVSTDDTLRLNGKGGNAFTVKLQATNQHNGNAVVTGHALPQNDVFGYFSFPPPTGTLDNPEVFVKVLDGRVINGEFWVFYGHLTDLIYDLTVTEVATGLVKTYHKDAGATAGGNDTSGFHPTPVATQTPAITATPTPTPTPTAAAAVTLNLTASSFAWTFDTTGGETATVHVGQQVQLRVRHVAGTEHQFSGLPEFGCNGSGLTTTAVCNFTPIASWVGTHFFGCTNSSCGTGHDDMQNGQIIVVP